MTNSLSLTNPERDSQFKAGWNKWLLIGPLLVLILFLAMYGCTRAVKNGSHEAYVLAEGFHAALARQDWDGIYANADDGYRKAITAEKSNEMFSSVVRKLGTPISCKQGGTQINANSSGNTIESSCETAFSSGALGTETFIWHKSGGVYRLNGYNLSSQDLLTR